MSPQNHVVASTITSCAFFFCTHSGEGTAACFLSGILIDIDHHFDLWIYKKKFLLGLKDIYHFCEKEKGERLYLIFHSYELIFLLWLSLFVFHLNLIWWGMAIGVSVHMIFDQILNPLRPGVYFLWYRIKNNFDKACIYPREVYQQME